MAHVSIYGTHPSDHSHGNVDIAQELDESDDTAGAEMRVEEEEEEGREQSPDGAENMF